MASIEVSAGKDYIPDKLWSRMREVPPLIVLLLVSFFLILIIAIFASQIAPYDPVSQKLLKRLKPPMILGGTKEYILGTDHLGRDLLSRLIFSTRTTLVVAAIGTVVGAVIGLLLGLISALAGSRIDTFIMFLVDARLAIPFTLLAIVAAAIFGAGLLVLILVIGLLGWAPYARLVRGQVLVIRNQIFIEASRSLGAGWWRIAVEHILPNIASSVIVFATLNLSQILLLESSLSFLGLGVQPPDVSLGLMVSAGRDYLAREWWLAILPSVLIIIIVLQISLIGDWLRDTLDPKLRDELSRH